MIYVKEEDVIKKYKIEVDKQNLESLKIKLINECSVIKHIKEKQREDNLTSDYDFMHIRNYSKRFIERVDNHDFYGSPLIDIYEVEYDFYIEPKIVKLIEEVLKGNEEKALELLEYKEDDEVHESLQDKLNKLLSNEDNFNNTEKVIYETKELLDEYKNTKYQKPVSIYLNDVKECVKLVLIDEISLEDYLRVYNFIDKEKQVQMDKSLRIKLVYKNT